MKFDRKESVKSGVKVLREDSVVKQEPVKTEKKQKKSEYKEEADFEPISFRDED